MIFFITPRTSVKKSSPNPSRKSPLQRGYSLIEILLVVAAISTVTAIGVFSLTNAREDTVNMKLQHDVAAINQAITIYRAHNGVVSDLTAPQAVLDRLKTRMTGDAAKQMVGLKKELVDKRLAAVLQTNAEQATTAPRAIWDATAAQFTIATTGANGVSEFILDEALALTDYGSHDRSSTFAFAKEKTWIWDNTSKAAADRTGPSSLPPSNGGLLPSKPTPPPNARLLAGPIFSIVTGSYPLGDYPLSLTLTNPNPEGVSNILYSINNGDWYTYTGPLDVDPTQKVSALVGSLDPDRWIDSDKKSEEFSTDPLAPEMELVFDKDAYTYAELGGAMLPGTTTVEPKKIEGDLSLTNSSSIPTKYQSSTYFTAKWTVDGSDPYSSSTAQTGEDFTDGFTGQKVPVTLADYGTQTKIDVRAGTNSLNTGIFTNSSIVSKTLGIEVVTLRPVLISADERDITMALDTSFSDMPVGARIYYTTDGTDPGNNGGQPIVGKLYGGIFELEGTAGSTVNITARVYPPVDYLNWFNPSSSVTHKVDLPISTEFYVGGNFYLTSGKGAMMRNIARLLGNGSVDSSFDVGSGASPNSLVGVIRQDAGGKVLAGGDFADVNSVVRPAIVRLNPNGSVDSGFDAALSGGK